MRPAKSVGSWRANSRPPVTMSPVWCVIQRGLANFTPYKSNFNLYIYKLYVGE